MTFVITGPGFTINHNNGTYSNQNVVGTFVATATGSSDSIQASFTLTRVQ